MADHVFAEQQRSVERRVQQLSRHLGVNECGAAPGTALRAGASAVRGPVSVGESRARAGSAGGRD
jgi:hypothetical protein